MQVRFYGFGLAERLGFDLEIGGIGDRGLGTGDEG